jgi:hypothetical protein
MTDLERALEVLERGLVTPRRTLRERMISHKVPGFSIALIDQGELAWAKGYGVLEAGGEEPVTNAPPFRPPRSANWSRRWSLAAWWKRGRWTWMPT